LCFRFSVASAKMGRKQRQVCFGLRLLVLLAVLIVIAPSWFFSIGSFLIFPSLEVILLLWRLLCDEYRSVVFKFLKLAMSPEKELSPSSRKKRESCRSRYCCGFSFCFRHKICKQLSSPL
jgi:hypothetical protein